MNIQPYLINVTFYYLDHYDGVHSINNLNYQNKFKITLEKLKYNLFGTTFILKFITNPSSYSKLIFKTTPHALPLVPS